MKLQKNLRKLRKKRGITQQRLSDMTGLTRTSYNGYENGVAEPNVKTLILLSNFHSVTLDELMK